MLCPLHQRSRVAYQHPVPQKRHSGCHNLFQEMTSAGKALLTSAIPEKQREGNLEDLVLLVDGPIAGSLKLVVEAAGVRGRRGSMSPYRKFC